MCMYIDRYHYLYVFIIIFEIFAVRSFSRYLGTPKLDPHH